MRSLIVVCLLAGCYKPTTDSCYYRCATQGTPCPSGLECVAGMCATPGDTCPMIGDDAMIDSPPIIDTPPPACGNGSAAPGEICYLPALAFPTNLPPFGGVLADRDGDGDLDLIYGTNTGFFAHENSGNVLLTPTLGGPTTSNMMTMRTANIDLGSPSHELIAVSDLRLETFAFNAGTHSVLSSYSGAGFVRALVVGNVSLGPVADLIVHTGNDLRVLRYDGNFSLTQVESLPASVAAGSGLATGRFNGDLRSDVALASSNGVSTFLSSTSGLTGETPTLMTTRVDGLEVGDVDGDGKTDIVFVVAAPAGNPGQLGVMRGGGDGTFGAPQTIQIADLGGALDVRDLDGDNLDDVIVVRTGGAMPRAVLIARGRTDGMLEMPVSFPLPGTSAEISARGDYNGDTVPDIVVTDRAGNTVYVFPSNP